MPGTGVLKMWTGTEMIPVPSPDGTMKAGEFPVIASIASADRGNFIQFSSINERTFGRKSTGTPQVWYSDDGWATQSTFRDMTTPGTLDWVYPVNEERVIVNFNGTDSADTGLYVVTPTTETKVLSWELGAASAPQAGFSLDRWPFHGADTGQVLLVAEYGPKTAGAFARLVHCSEDYGDTWRTLFTLPEETPGGTHLHGPNYDPFADRVWIVSGDVPGDNVWYSDDWQAPVPTWTRVWPANQAVMQFTSCYAVSADLVLFATDKAGKQGIWAWERDPNNPAGVPDIQPWAIIEDNPLLRYVARSFIPNAEGTGFALWFTTVSGRSRPSVLYGSGTNGRSWRAIYETAIDVSVIQLATFQNKLVWREGGDKLTATVTWA